MSRAFVSLRKLRLSKKDVVISGAIRQDSRINDLTAGTALPCIESTDKIVVFLSVHATFTLWTPHLITSSKAKQYMLSKLTYADTT